MTKTSCWPSATSTRTDCSRPRRGAHTARTEAPAETGMTAFREDSFLRVSPGSARVRPRGDHPRNPVHSVLFLVLAFVPQRGAVDAAEAEFLAIVLVLVYVGAVMVLFLFVVMMLDINVASKNRGASYVMRPSRAGRRAHGGEMASVVWLRSTGLPDSMPPSPRAADYSNTEELGSGAVHRARSMPSRSPPSSCWWHRRGHRLTMRGARA
jgi:hypothetical protein